MSNQPILFCSTRCSHSKQILDTLKALNKEGLFRLFWIDGKQRHELPAFLRNVPTLYLPETKDVVIGKDIYGYVAKPVQSRRELPVTQNAQPPGPRPTVAAKQMPSEPTSWSFGTSGGFTEAYSSWDKPGAFSTEDQLHYTYLNGSAATPPLAPEPVTKQSYSGDKSNRNDDVNSRLEAYKKEREVEFKGINRQ